MPKKKDKYVGPDPDPADYLYVSLESKRLSSERPYDAKKSCWVPCPKDGFAQGDIRGVKGDQITVFASNKEQNLKKEQILQVNPPKFDKMDDMSNLTYLNDATVLWNLKDRYYNQLIYTYSGLFCVAVNPYRRFPIYTPRVVNMYRSKRRTEMPPHVFAVSDGAYSDMLNNRENQSMLITGESGAGKTENTKKVISYFATVGANEYKDGNIKKANLEDQVVQTNPVLETFGNAKTVRNDNSSRFGKFIRIHFMSNGKLAGADIEVYLLEKARVISQQPGERSYHIFYQLMSGGFTGLKDELFLTGGWEDFPNQSMGVTEIEGVVEKDELRITDNCMDVLGFDASEKKCIYKIAASVMHLGRMKIKQRGREEQAEADGTQEGETVAKLLDIESDDLYRNLLKPKIKVGNEYVTQGRTKDQVCFSIGALCKAIYDKLFKWLVNRCNRTLSTQSKKSFFIGVLDIAGFEIFEHNSFEQLCINFTNEKLQQFFNHHMFVLEQEEYQREGIQWTFIDFGLDLQACIDLIEKPLGIFSILEEESMFPKASDKTFEEKLKNNHMGKTNSFANPKGNKDPNKNAHFAIVHYAGTVPYNVTGWLEKNKDPLNETVIEQFRKSGMKLLNELFEDNMETPAVTGTKAKRAKGSTFQTVSALYREQVENLMATLRKTFPHFIRCIIPNENKEAGIIDSNMVMNQLTCNGVLEGIRICRKGFPNRMQYKEFRQRYLVLASSAMMTASNDKDAAFVCFQSVGLEEDKYRLGNTKLFFRTGVVAYMEELREEKIQQMMKSVQAQCRTYLARKRFKKLVDQSTVIGVNEDRIKELERKIESQRTQMKEEEKMLDEFGKELDRTLGEKQKLQMEIEEQKAAMREIEIREVKLKLEAAQREEDLKETLELLVQEEEKRNAIEQAKKKAEAEVKVLQSDLHDLEAQMIKSEQSRKEKEHQIRTMQDELEQQEDVIARLHKEKRHLQEIGQKSAEDLQIAEDKNINLAKIKAKLEATLDDLEDSLEQEKKLRLDQERNRRKAEAEVKSMQAAIEAVERSKKESDAATIRKEKEISALSDKLDSEQTNLLKSNKQIKECGVRINDLEEELDNERNYRLKAEQQRVEVTKELHDLQERLDEAGGATAVQIELNKKREAELNKLKREAEEAAIQRESALANLRKRHAEAMGDMEHQVEAGHHARLKLEREKSNLYQDLMSSKAMYDKMNVEKALLDRELKSSNQKFQDVQLRLDEAGRNLSDLEIIRNKLTSQNLEFERKLDEAETQTSQLSKLKVSLETQLADAIRLAEDEAKERLHLMSKFRNAESDRESMRQHLEETLEEKEDMMRQLSRANGEATLWRSKYETESAGKIEELEHAKMKLQARLAEAEETIEGLNSRCVSLEKLKQRLTGEIDDLQMQMDSANQIAIALEKKAKNFDKVVAEWKSKVEELTQQLEEAQRENRENSSEVFRLRSQLEDSRDQTDTLKRENKNISLEIKDLLDQLGEGGRSLHEVERQKRRVESEKEELANALDEAEAALEAEENRVIRANFELATLKQEIDKRIQEKCDEFMVMKKNQQRLIESLQASLEAEARSKAEVMRTKKKLETDIQELENALDHASRAHAETMANCRRQQTEMRDLKDQIEELRRELEMSRDSISVAERKATSASHEAEEARTLLATADKLKRQVEHELSNTRESLNETSAQLNSVATSKRALEADYSSVRAEMDEMGLAMRQSEEKAKRTALDAMKLAEDARIYQERATREESERRSLEATIKEMQIRLEEAESNALRGGKKLIEKLEHQVRNLNEELDHEQRFKADLTKNLRKAERKYREMEFQFEEEKKLTDRLQEMNDLLQEKLRNFKVQIEDAEEIAALNLAKFRKAQTEVEEAEKRANLAEQAMGKLRARSVMRSDTPF